MMRRSICSFSPAAALLLTMAVSASALAQETPPPAAPPQPPPVSTGGAGSGAGFGVGAATFLSGLSGIQVVYDMRQFHIEGVFAFESINAGAMDNRITTFQFGARGWYHVHNGSNSDFSLGGGAGVIAVSGGGSPTAMVLDPGMLGRVFLTSNFALHVTAGVSMRFGDDIGTTNEGFGLSSQVMGGFGFTYFFR